MSLSKGLASLANENRVKAESLERRAGAVVGTTARRIQDTARAVAPVDTGNLRDSILVARDGETRAAVVATASYASYVENGTTRQAPQPYMSTATIKHEQEFYDMLGGLFD